jgi:carnitine O-acetyltransferase
MSCLAKRDLEQGEALPAFFQDEGFTRLNHTILSTSNCGNPALRLFGFGPVVPDGFGIGCACSRR